jgi:hypothetical protein
MSRTLQFTPIRIPLIRPRLKVGLMASLLSRRYARPP